MRQYMLCFLKKKKLVWFPTNYRLEHCLMRIMDTQEIVSPFTIFIRWKSCTRGNFLSHLNHKAPFFKQLSKLLVTPKKPATLNDGVKSENILLGLTNIHSQSIG